MNLTGRGVYVCIWRASGEARGSGGWQGIGTILPVSYTLWYSLSMTHLTGGVRTGFHLPNSLSGGAYYAVMGSD